jgi:hypothetical protein
MKELKKIFQCWLKQEVIDSGSRPACDPALTSTVTLKICVFEHIYRENEAHISCASHVSRKSGFEIVTRNERNTQLSALHFRTFYVQSSEHTLRLLNGPAFCRVGSKPVAIAFLLPTSLLVSCFYYSSVL